MTEQHFICVNIIICYVLDNFKHASTKGHGRVSDSQLRPPAAILKIGQFRLPHFAYVFQRHIKAVGPVYQPGQTKHPTQGTYMLSFRNANPGDLDVNWRASEKRGFIRKSEGLRKSGIYM